MGYTRNGVLPAGLTFFGRAWVESTLIRLAYGYEHVTHHRHPPSTTRSSCVGIEVSYLALLDLLPSPRIKLFSELLC